MINKPCVHDIRRALECKQDTIDAWLKTHEGHDDLPLFSSVDIRESSFKYAVVDTNLFPAGFNNICKSGLTQALPHLKNTLLKRVPNSQRILLITEEHTRNTWYLENVYVLSQMLQSAGFEVILASFLDVEPEFCDEVGYIELETAKQNTVKLHCLASIIKKVDTKELDFDLIILNNDLTQGIPQSLTDSKVRIYPALKAGWHSRLKSHHFEVANDLIAEFSKIIDCDPWHFSCEFNSVKNVSITEEQDRIKLADSASDLLKRVQKKYTEYNIDEKPFLFLKADSGTYGMGVLPIEDPKDILELNRKGRNKLAKGKSSQPIESFILQEGVPSIHLIDQKMSEVCIYQINNEFVGGFYRQHDAKSPRENLNSKGMTFKTICVSETDGCCDNPGREDLNLYTVLARLAGIAAHREIQALP